MNNFNSQNKYLSLISNFRFLQIQLDQEDKIEEKLETIIGHKSSEMDS